MILSEFIAIAGIHFLAVVSPGPDTAIVINNSVKFGRSAGILTAAGVGCGIIIHVLYSALGIGYIVQQSVLLQQVMMTIAAIYLGYLGVMGLKSWASAYDADFDSPQGQISKRKPFLNGFITNGLNPKATLFFIALFTAVVSEQTPLLDRLGYGVYLVFATFAWFAFLASVIGHPRIQKQLQQSYKVVNVVMGLLLLLIAFRLAWSIVYEM
ncbi:LysE family translocator [Echinimonas agarilytica]|uniref:LysE family translocator n=1 Tax=Echinimonas agarilytica TaxID=1215918 RepID=A0AA41WB24_9GAMM|nr:LysE family translocator [Echinimonas agarilytica]MCM2681198.1 LysE family translocator [Echinimonas agarilytica]